MAEGNCRVTKLHPNRMFKRSRRIPQALDLAVLSDQSFYSES